MTERVAEPLTTTSQGSPAVQTNVSVNEQPVLGLTGFFLRISTISALAILVGLYILDRFDARNVQKEMITDLKETIKEERKSQAETADKAHRMFLEESVKVRESNSKQWEQVRTMTDEVRKLGAAHSETQREIKDMIKEVKSIKMNGGGN